MRRPERRRHEPPGRPGSQAGEQYGCDSFGLWQHLDGHFFKRCESSVGAGHQLGEIIAGDVFDDLAAGLEDLGAAADGVETEKMVARRAGFDPPRAG